MQRFGFLPLILTLAFVSWIVLANTLRAEDIQLTPKEHKGKFGYVDQAGGFVIEPKFEKAHSFSEGLAAVSVSRYVSLPNYEDQTPGRISSNQKRYAKSEWGYIDANGKFVIKPSFDQAADFSEGLAAGRVGHRYGYIDQTGRFMIKPRFSEASDFVNGRAAVSDKSASGFVDKTGKSDLPPNPAYTPRGKLSRGLKNLLLGWAIMPEAVVSCFSNELALGIMGGPPAFAIAPFCLAGIIPFVALKEATGAVEVLTFPAPWPDPYYEPLFGGRYEI